jgi:spore coat polysaccharide biosynthesis protein SpsF
MIRDTVVVIQARMASSRLPDKVMHDLGGSPVLDWVVRRAARSTAVGKVVVATSDQESDNLIAKFCEQQGYLCYRGSHFDVLDRVYQAAKAHNAAYVIRLTADCPLIDPVLITKTVQFFWGGFGGDTLLDEPLFDFAANRLPPPTHRTFPIGLDTEITTFEALETAWNEATAPHEREHVMPFLYENQERFKTAVLHHEEDLGDLRWTLDTAEDLEFLRAVVARFPDDTFTWQDVHALLQREPELAEINANVAHRGGRDVDERGEEG